MSGATTRQPASASTRVRGRRAIPGLPSSARDERDYSAFTDGDYDPGLATGRTKQLSDAAGGTRGGGGTCLPGRIALSRLWARSGVASSEERRGANRPLTCGFPASSLPVSNPRCDQFAGQLGRLITHKPLAGGSNPPPATSTRSEGRRWSRVVRLRGHRIAAHHPHAPVSGRFWPQGAPSRARGRGDSGQVTRELLSSSVRVSDVVAGTEGGAS